MLFFNIIFPHCEWLYVMVSRPLQCPNAFALLAMTTACAGPTDLHCVINYDPDCISFRITLFPNITNDKRVPAPHHLTVEVLIDDYNVAELACQVFSELKHIG